MASQLKDIDKILISNLMGWKIHCNKDSKTIKNKPEKLLKELLIPKNIKRYKVFYNLF